MRPKLLLLAVALLVASPIFAAEPKISLSIPVTVAPAPVPVPDPVVPGQLIQVKVTGLTLDLAKRCFVDHYPRPKGTIFFPAIGWDGTMCIFFSAPVAGEYKIGIYSPPESAGGAVVGAEVLVPVGAVPPVPPPPGPPTPPNPPTPPVPPVPPPPVVQKIQVVVIEETADSTPAWAKVRNSEAIRKWATAGGHSIFFIDQDVAKRSGGTWKDFADRTAGKGLPYAFIAPHGGGTTIHEQTAPGDETGFLALVQKYGGKTAAPPVIITGSSEDGPGVPASGCGPLGCPVPQFNVPLFRRAR